jgi:hypothetical protein
MIFKINKLFKYILIALIAAAFKLFYGIPVEFSEIDFAASSFKAMLPEVNYTTFDMNKLMFDKYLNYAHGRACFNATYINDLTKEDADCFSTISPQARIGKVHKLFVQVKIPLLYAQMLNSIYLPKKIELYKFENFTLLDHRSIYRYQLLFISQIQLWKNCCR